MKKFWCPKNSIRLCRYHQYINQGQFKWLYRIEDYVDLNNPNSWGLAKHTSRAGVRYVLGLILKEWSNKLLQPVHNVGPETEKNDFDQLKFLPVTTTAYDGLTIDQLLHTFCFASFRS